MSRGRRKLWNSYIRVHIDVPDVFAKEIEFLRAKANEEGKPLYLKIVELVHQCYGQELQLGDGFKSRSVDSEDIAAEARYLLTIEEIQHDYNLILEANNKILSSLKDTYMLNRSGFSREVYKCLNDIRICRMNILKNIAKIPRPFYTESIKEMFYKIRDLSLLEPEVRSLYHKWLNGSSISKH